MPMTRGQLARARSGRAIKDGKLIPATHCEMCGDEAKTDGHHPDYDHPLVVQWLCRRCHMIADGRMKAIHSIDRHQPPKPCLNCERLVKPLRKGRCHPCNEYLRRHGVERPYVKDGRQEKTVQAYRAPCLRCKRRANIV